MKNYKYFLLFFLFMSIASKTYSLTLNDGDLMADVCVENDYEVEASDAFLCSAALTTSSFPTALVDSTSQGGEEKVSHLIEAIENNEFEAFIIDEFAFHFDCSRHEIISAVLHLNQNSIEISFKSLEEAL